MKQELLKGLVHPKMKMIS